MKAFIINRCPKCGRIYRYGKWIMVKELRPDVMETFIVALNRGCIDWNKSKQCVFCEAIL